MSLGWPAAAAACVFAGSAGRFLPPNSRMPAAIAPELTKTTSTPARRICASSLAKRATRGRSRCPPSRVKRLVPILTTTRPIRFAVGTVRFAFIFHLIEKLFFPYPDGVAILRALAIKLLFDAHLLQNIHEAPRAFLLVEIRHSRELFHLGALDDPDVIAALHFKIQLHHKMHRLVFIRLFLR